jgi:glucokinase
LNNVVEKPVADAETAFLAADVGGTFARVALVRELRGGAHPVQVLQYRKYRCAEYPSLGAILREFSQAHGVRVRRCALACAGFLLDDNVINTSLPWNLSVSATRAEADLGDLALVNDFTAVAYAADQVPSEETILLAGGSPQDRGGPSLVVGPGTGLGAAVRIPDGGECIVLATEAGQSAFAPNTSREMDILRLLTRKHSHVPVEMVVSGPGLVNIYRALCELDGRAPALDQPSAISDAAVAGSDAIALEALQIFCGAIGSLVGNLVLLYGASGGVYLAGGVLPRISEFLRASSFVERLLDKGPMREMLEQVPVRLIEHGQLGVVGAAIWYLQRQRAATRAHESAAPHARAAK